MQIYIDSLIESIQSFMLAHMTLFIVVCVFIFLDIISGLIVAFVDGEYSSRAFRKGLGNKLAYVLVMCAVAIVQVAMFDSQFDVPFEFPLFAIVCGFIILLEFTSIVENACKLNPELDSLFGKFFNNYDYKYLGDGTYSEIDYYENVDLNSHQS